jgi:hypothetical protein
VRGSSSAGQALLCVPPWQLVTSGSIISPTGSCAAGQQPALGSGGDGAQAAAAAADELGLVPMSLAARMPSMLQAGGQQLPWGNSRCEGLAAPFAAAAEPGVTARWLISRLMDRCKAV